MISRLSLTVGGLLAVLLTPTFSLSYFLSFGDGHDESPPGWLAQLSEPLLEAGLLEAAGSSAAYSLYTLYGRLYLMAWVLALIGLAGMLRPEWSQFTSRLRRAWAVLLIGLCLVTLGILGEYGATSDSVNTLGFGFTILGFLGAAAGCGLLGWALWRDRRVNSWTVVGWARSAWSLRSEGTPWSRTSRPGLAWGSSALRSSWGLLARVHMPPESLLKSRRRALET